MSNIQNKIKELHWQNSLVDLFIVIFIGIITYQIISSFVLNVLMPALSVIAGKNLLDSKISFPGIMNNNIFLYLFSGKLLHGILVLVIASLFITILMLIFKKGKKRSKKILKEETELSNADLLHVEMRDLLKNLKDILELIKEIKK